MLSVRDLRRPGLVSASFELANGECITVQGRSGSGKTLLLRAIADLDPSEGVVTLDGVSRDEILAPLWRRSITYVSTVPGWWAETVGAHFPDWSTVLSLVEKLGFPADCNTWPVQRLSTGERQRLGIIRAVVLRPRVLLLDEPTSGLDAAATVAVENLVTSQFKEGTSGVWVSHDESQAQRVARRRLVFEEDGVREKLL
jgi:putative ABC transport system ATP-binding protein